MKLRLFVSQLAMVAVCAQAGTGLAAWGDGPGCGLGKMLFDKEPKSVLLQHFGSTSNVPSQPFALSSGTSGCTNNGMIVKEEQTTLFASLNFDNLSQDMAKGHGEHLASLATLMGVPSDRQAEFFSLAQDNYLTLIQAGDASPSAMLTALQRAMEGHPVLAKASSSR